MVRLKELRKEKKITQEQLSKKLHVARTTVTMWEKGILPNADMLDKIAEFFGVTVDYLLERSDEPEPFSMPSNIIPITRKRVPLLGKIAAGVPTYADEQHDEYVIAGEDENVDFALEVDGDSMEPTLKRGDLVFFRAQDDVNDGQIAAVIIDDEATLKHVFHMKQGVQLVSENLKYAPMTFRENVRIIGVAKYYRRALS